MAAFPPTVTRPTSDRQHTFRVSQGDYRNRRFQYGGYWFGFADPWPSNWLYTQDVYVSRNRRRVLPVQSELPGREPRAQLHTLASLPVIPSERGSSTVIGAGPFSWTRANFFEAPERSSPNFANLVAAFSTSEQKCTDPASAFVESLSLTRRRSIHAARSSKVGPGNRRMIWQGGSK